MANRQHSTTVNGGGFSPAIVNSVWEKANVIPDPNIDSQRYRMDRYGNQIYRSSYGLRGTQSWEIDHKRPVAQYGTDHIDNLQPLQWKENRIKSNHYPYSDQQRQNLIENGH